jgi:hypothetical protein
MDELQRRHSRAQRHVEQHRQLEYHHHSDRYVGRYRQPYVHSVHTKHAAGLQRRTCQSDRFAWRIVRVYGTGQCIHRPGWTDADLQCRCQWRRATVMAHVQPGHPYVQRYAEFRRQLDDPGHGVGWHFHGFRHLHHFHVQCGPGLQRHAARSQCSGEHGRFMAAASGRLQRRQRRYVELHPGSTAAWLFRALLRSERQLMGVALD